MFITRTISGAILLLIMCTTIVLGSEVWLAATVVLSFIAMYEMLRVFNLHKTLIAVAAYICNAGLYTLLFFGLNEYLLSVMIICFILFMAIYVILWPKYTVSDISKAVFTFIYTGFCMSFLYQTRMLDNGIFYIWLVFIGAWGSDTCAYLTGILIGKHKLPSTLSPKKTIEGCLGGIVGAGVLGGLYGAWANKEMTGNVNYIIIFAIAGAVASVLSQIGDLCASAVKRNCEIKDYGKLIPGHGGIMDRFDSIVFLNPIIYYMLFILGNIGWISI